MVFDWVMRVPDFDLDPLDCDVGVTDLTLGLDFE